MILYWCFHINKWYDSKIILINDLDYIQTKILFDTTVVSILTYDK